MAAPALIQNPSRIALASSDSDVLSGAVGSWDQSVAANSTLIIAIHQTSTDTRTFGVSDDIDGAWTALTLSTSTVGVQVQLFYSLSHTGGTVTVTVTSNFAVAKDVQLVEIGESTFDVESVITAAVGDVDGTEGYPCSASATVIDTAANVFVIASSTLDAAGTLDGASNSYANLDTPGSALGDQYLRSSSVLTNERGWFAESGTDRASAGAIASFASAAATAAITGTAVATIDESDVVAGAKDIILTLTGDTWVSA